MIEQCDGYLNYIKKYTDTARYCLNLLTFEGVIRI